MYHLLLLQFGNCMHEVDDVDSDRYSYIDLLTDCLKFMFPKVCLDITIVTGMKISNDRELMDMFAAHEHVDEINLFVKPNGRKTDFTLSHMPPTWNEDSDSNVEKSDDDDQFGDGIDEVDEGQENVYDFSDEDDEWINTKEDNDDSSINFSDYEYEPC
ncbi:hypothetical protein CFOL_v3_21390 [Cephalotus follicularis]|uniref:Uncharacterized protein n=1 Tax=Cephalotus follicularis TaxID=3775 RepID=A0A1Q3CCS8_CEPFO|nr:hypothetical protein CFOL_v3_21390 [Cephalotus follicularis]